MKFFISYATTVILLALFAGTLLWFFKSVTYSQNTAISPLPEFLDLSKNKQVSSINLFLPVIELLSGDEDAEPVLTAKAAIAYDMTSGKTLLAKNQKKRLPMASLTKVMTAMIGVDNKLLTNQYIVHKDYLVGENSMGLLPGESHTLENLLYGLILLSGNDAAETIANHYPTGRQDFITAMNNKAKALGLTNTNFTNPSGLEGDGEQYSTAYDLLVITNHALNEYPLFTKIARTVTYEIPATEQHQSYYLENETNLLTSYPGVKGIKTGFTYEAGYCLITYLEYKDHKIIAVLLGSENRRQEMKDILDYSLRKLGTIPPKHE